MLDKFDQALRAREHEDLDCDREDMRVQRHNLNGSNHKMLVQTGGPATSDIERQSRSCVGVAVNPQAGEIYWNPKGSS
ncbi:hypothetical protein ACJQWK_02180 [Exserohilum turcicum]